MRQFIWRNVTRRKNKLILSMLLSGIAVFFFVAVWSVLALAGSGLELSRERMGADVILYSDRADTSAEDMLYTGLPQMVYMDEKSVRDALPAEDMESCTEQFFLHTLGGQDCCSTDQTIRIVGIDQNTDFLIKPWLEKMNGSGVGADELIVGSDTENEFGDTTRVLGELFQVKGTLYATGTGMDESIFMDIGTARKLAVQTYGNRFLGGENAEDLVSSFLIRLKPGVSEESFISKLDTEALGIRAVSISGVQGELRDQLMNVSGTLTFFWLAIVILSVTALFIHYNSLIRSRTAEIGYLRAIGMSAKSVLRMLLGEVFIQGLFGGVLGSAAGTAAVPFMTAGLRSLTTISFGEWTALSAAGRAAGGIVLSLVISLLAAAAPVIRCVRSEPAKAISEGEL